MNMQACMGACVSVYVCMCKAMYVRTYVSEFMAPGRHIMHPLTSVQPT